MKNSVALLALALMLGTAFALGQSNLPQPLQEPVLSHITGVWRGQMDGLPAITMVITDEGGSLTQAVFFYFHMRKTDNDPYISTPGLPEPLFNLHLDGSTLTFQVSHRRAHPSGSLNDPPVRFHLTVTGPNRAELVNESEKGLELAVVRSDQ